MANRSFLLSNHSDDPQAVSHDSDRILAASNSIPTLWYSIFGSDDACTRTDEFGLIPGFIADTDLGLRRLDARWSRLLGWLPAELYVHLDAWRTLIESLDAPYIQLDPHEIALVETADSLTEYNQICVRAYDHGRAEVALVLFDQIGLDFDP